MTSIEAEQCGAIRLGIQTIDVRAIASSSSAGDEDVAARTCGKAQEFHLASGQLAALRPVAVDTQLQAVAREWDAALQGDVATQKTIMAKLNDLLNRRSYIRNLVANVQKELL